jgi:arylsulfatase
MPWRRSRVAAANLSNWANMKPLSITESGIRGIASRDGHRVEKTELSLYNVKSDPGETHSVAAANPEIVRRLQKAMDVARADLAIHSPA